MTSILDKRVVVYLPSLEMGGSERQGLRLAAYLQRECGAKVEVWGVAGEGLGTVFCDKEGIPWRIVPVPWQTSPLKRLRTVRTLKETLSLAKPDILLPFTVTPSFICGLLWEKVGASLSIWNQRDTLGHTPGFFWQQAAVRKTPLFVSNSGHGAKYLTDFLGAPREKIRVVHNGIQLDAPLRTRAEWRFELQASKDQFVAVMVANLHADKDHATVLRAWKKVLGRVPGTSPVFVMAGYHGNRYEELRQLSRDLHIEEHVRFLGQVTDVPGLLAASDLGIMSSKSEGSPNSLLECMAAGLPIVGSAVPGIEEAVGQGGRFLFPVGDAEALSRLVVDFMADPQLRQAAGEENRRRIGEAFSPNAMCRQMVSVIEEGLTAP
ncbi:glycosyltransferase family 4 protein [Geomonas sp. RF6]|uniref:glycosyltransferase family 4 protein n=1 Tax=Geomonas sp. RF6 TaxID=2897342 RepID=UPI001E62B6F7|nr:glycosyltransferase family 4 protein [Geomonas sp. RF6]UFS72703.1 glycosyltransferase family 4 protein [Geomonas sp. RF6]